MDVKDYAKMPEKERKTLLQRLWSQKQDLQASVAGQHRALCDAEEQTFLLQRDIDAMQARVAKLKADADAAPARIATLETKLADVTALSQKVFKAEKIVKLLALRKELAEAEKDVS